jgi:thiamine-phosphate pyrophosphorylase
MARRQSPLPSQWLMTDARMGAALWAALEGLPRGSGVVVRRDEIAAAPRIASIARRRRLTLAIAADERIASRHRAAMIHNPTTRRSALRRSFAVHDQRELTRARLLSASAIFLSPLFATRSHPQARPLGRMRAATLARLARPLPVYALGGVTQRRFRSLRPLSFAGWAGIDAWIRT